MSKEICPMCAEEICICGEAYKSLGASQLEVLIPILVRQYENLPEYQNSMARHVNFYGGVAALPLENFHPAPRMLEHREFNGDMYFGRPQQSGYASRQNDQTFRYDMLIPGLIVRWGEHHGKLVSVTERNSEADLRYKMLSVEDPERGVALFATGPVDNYNWPDLDGQHHTNVRILDMFIEVPDEMREGVAKHLVSLGHERVHRKLALMFGTRHSSLSDGLELGKPPYGFGHEKRAFDYSQVSSNRLVETGERNPDNADDRLDGRVSLTNLGRVFRRPGITTGLFTASDMMKYRRLSPGAKFQFLETAGPDFTGEWVVTGFQLFDEDQGPKLQVASIVAMRGDESMAFYTSYSVDQVDEKMVPFVSMEHVQILNDSWDVVEEPSFSEYKALKVGKSIGFLHLPQTLKLEILEVEYRQKNYGLSCPEQYMVIVKLSVPAEQREAGDGQEFFSFYTGNVNVFYVPGTSEYIPLSSIAFPE